jgi:hypothetical protein
MKLRAATIAAAKYNIPAAARTEVAASTARAKACAAEFTIVVYSS